MPRARDLSNSKRGHVGCATRRERVILSLSGASVRWLQVANVDIRCRGRQALPSLGWVCFHSGPADHISRVLACGPDFTKDFGQITFARASKWVGKRFSGAK